MSINGHCRLARRAAMALGIWLASATCAVAADIIFVSDFSSSHLIRWVRLHAKAGGASIVLEPALVTAKRFSGGGTTATIYIQVPPELNGNASYPEFSALKTFGSVNGATPVEGDCVIVSGTITRFNGASELTSAVWTQAGADACGSTPITAYASLFVSSVATDGDPNTAGNQPGISAEAFESVLIRLNEPVVLNTNGGSGPFQIGDAVSGTGVYLLVGPFLYQYNAVASTQLQSVTGVLDEFDTMTDTVYQLLPRTAADIVE